MIALDVNVVVAALRPDAPRHDELRPWLETAAAGPEAVGLSDAVLTGAMRVLTHPRIFSPPSSPIEVLAALEALLAAPAVSRLVAGTRFWTIFSGLCREADARGNLVSDAAHAALAIEQGATWITFDRDFARFPGLTWRTPV